MAATSLRTIQTLSTSSGHQAWNVARTTAVANPAVNSHHGHLTLYTNPATNNSNPETNTAPSCIANSNQTTAINSNTAHLNHRATINQYQSINSHNQYIYNHHLQLSHNHSQQQQQQQRRALQLQSQAHSQQRHYQPPPSSQQHRQQPQPQQPDQTMNQFYNSRQPQVQNMINIHPRAPLHYRSASPPPVQVNNFRPPQNNNAQRKSPPPTTTRRRSSSIRIPPPSLPLPLVPQTPPTHLQQHHHHHGMSASTPTFPSPPKSSIKFDPFADESDVLEGVGLNHAATTYTAPYTIQIPAAVPSEIQRYAVRSSLGGHRLNGPRRTPSPPNPIARPVSPPKSESDSGLGMASSIRGAPTPQSSPTRSEMGGGNPFGVVRLENPPLLALSPPARLPVFVSPSVSSAPALAPPVVSASPPPPPPRAARPQPTPNLSKLVAGILLNRVHAVGKPMRRNPRCGDEGDVNGNGNGGGFGDRYVRSALRWEVCV